MESYTKVQYENVFIISDISCIKDTTTTTFLVLSTVRPLFVRTKNNDIVENTSTDIIYTYTYNM